MPEAFGVQTLWRLAVCGLRNATEERMSSRLLQGDFIPENGKRRNAMFSNALVLVAGGDVTDRETILQTLGDEFHVVAAQTMDDALAHAEDAIGLVICDLESNQLGGAELVKLWKDRQPHTPFLALTDGKDVSSAVEAMKNGVADCLVKPIDQDDLRATAMQLVDPSSENRTQNGNGRQSVSSGKSHIDIPPGTSLEDLERAAVEQALIQHQGNRTHAAKTLGISVRTLQRKLKAWGMPIVSFPNSAPSNNFLMSPHSLPHAAFSTHAH
jgi:DNA-binding NtrC family response regulator